MSSRQAHLRRARHWIANRGWRGFFAEMRARFGLRLRGKPIPGHPGPETGPHPFDLAYHVDTAGLIWGEAATPSAGSRDAGYWATGYYGVAPSAFDSALRRLALPWPAFTFVDIGCGKGRALLLSLAFPFRRIVGVELSADLADVARRNLQTFHAPWRRPEVRSEVLTADATTVLLPAGPLVCFLYHPFAAPVMRRFLAHLLAAARAESRDIYLLYTNPELAHMLQATSGITRLWAHGSTLTPEETAADRFRSTNEYTVAYRVMP